MIKYLIAFLLILSIAACKKEKLEVVADFSVNYRKINAGEKIKFTDKSRNNPETWNWIFSGGNPMISEEQNPEVSYNTPGFYAVSLTVSNADGNSSLIKSEYIEVVTFTCGNPIIDIRDYKLYETIAINNYCWMKENLNTGTYIQSNTTPANNGIIEKYCFNNEPDKCNTYGGLYKWDEMMMYDNSSLNGICPQEFFVPSQTEINDLINYAGGFLIAGGKLKQDYSNFWDAPNFGASNEFGFEALGTGYLQDDVFMNLHRNTFFGLSEEMNTLQAQSIMLSFDNAIATDTIINKNSAISLRCVRNLN